MQAHHNSDTSASEVVRAYLTSFYDGDFDGAQALVADDFAFDGPFVSVTGKEAFFASAEGLRRITRGHRLLRHWEDAGEVCSIYEVDLATPVAEGSVLMTEWHVVRDGRLASGRVVFDSAAFRALLPAA
ncbi:MAG TPA: nuclear transport factor 2 family protein [Baekduia sp.]|uniref:nuclear transport factor 2 family protein n=1 Tax=Baekduia sp. TaxID=2600305 RepID=UPI002BDDF317|nr:nuclear transport factor 2 family protein [Baekduia sp.]HMJ35582.1 nuclear transport factor 2 family protein [Baekduia sp.]